MHISTSNMFIVTKSLKIVTTKWFIHKKECFSRICLNLLCWEWCKLNLISSDITPTLTLYVLNISIWINFYLKWEWDHLKLKCISQGILFMIGMMISLKGIKLLRNFLLILNKPIFLKNKSFRKDQLWTPIWKLLLELYRR